MKMVTSSAIVFRRALPEEADTLCELALRSKGHWGYSEQFLRDCQSELTYSAAQIQVAPAFVVAEFEAILVGFYALFPSQGEHEYELEALFVEPSYIGRGIGRALMEHAKETAVAHGARSLIIQGDPHAEPFYRMAGGDLVGIQESGSIPGRMLPVFRVRLEAAGGA